MGSKDGGLLPSSLKWMAIGGLVIGGPIAAFAIVMPRLPATTAPPPPGVIESETTARGASLADPRDAYTVADFVEVQREFSHWPRFRSNLEDFIGDEEERPGRALRFAVDFPEPATEEELVLGAKHAAATAYLLARARPKSVTILTGSIRDTPDGGWRYYALNLTLEVSFQEEGKFLKRTTRWHKTETREEGAAGKKKPARDWRNDWFSGSGLTLGASQAVGPPGPAESAQGR